MRKKKKQDEKGLIQKGNQKQHTRTFMNQNFLNTCIKTYGKLLQQKPTRNDWCFLCTPKSHGLFSDYLKTLGKGDHTKMYQPHL